MKRGGKLKRGGPIGRRHRMQRKKRIRQFGARKKREAAAIKAFRRAVLKRDGYRCRRCKRTPPPGAADSWLEAHHLRLQSQDTNHHPDNGVTLCFECHDKIHMHSPDAPDWRDWIKQRGDESA